MYDFFSRRQRMEKNGKQENAGVRGI